MQNLVYKRMTLQKIFVFPQTWPSFHLDLLCCFNTDALKDDFICLFPLLSIFLCFFCLFGRLFLFFLVILILSVSSVIISTEYSVTVHGLSKGGLKLTAKTQ